MTSVINSAALPRQESQEALIKTIDQCQEGHKALAAHLGGITLHICSV